MSDEFEVESEFSFSDDSSVEVHGVQALLGLVGELDLAMSTLKSLKGDLWCSRLRRMQALRAAITAVVGDARP